MFSELVVTCYMCVILCSVKWDASVRYCYLPSEMKPYVCCCEHISRINCSIYKAFCFLWVIKGIFKVICGFIVISPAATAVLSWTDTWLGSSFVVLWWSQINCDSTSYTCSGPERHLMDFRFIWRSRDVHYSVHPRAYGVWPHQ